jgi:hypothetical protein
VLTDTEAVNNAGAEGDGTEIADVPSKGRARGDTDKFADDTVVIDASPGVNYTVATYMREPLFTTAPAIITVPLPISTNSAI